MLAVQRQGRDAEGRDGQGRIPAGVDTGSRVRIPGKGEGGRLGAPPGDLFIITNVGKHKHFTRKGDNIYVTVPMTVAEAALGAKIEVPTVEGKAQLKIPPGTQSGQKFRLRERGVPSLAQPAGARRPVRRSAGHAPEGHLGRDEGTLQTLRAAQPREPARGDGTGVDVIQCFSCLSFRQALEAEAVTLNN